MSQPPASPSTGEPAISGAVVEGVGKLRMSFLLSLLAIVIALAALALAQIGAGLSTSPEALLQASAATIAVLILSLLVDLAAVYYLFTAAKTFHDYDPVKYGRGWTGVKLVLGGLAAAILGSLILFARSIAGLALLAIGLIAMLAGYVYLALFLKDLADLAGTTGIRTFEKLNTVGNLYLIAIILAFTVILAPVSALLSLIATIMGYTYTTQIQREIEAKALRPPGAPPPIHPR